MGQDDLDAEMLAAHAANDKSALQRLYTRAANGAKTAEERAFFLTHAYVYALDAGSPDAKQLRARLIALGAET